LTQVVWLASYPKSGNTWARAFLANYLNEDEAAFDINKLPQFSFGDMRIEHYARVSGKAEDELTANEIDRLRPHVHRFFANARKGLVFVKTHSAVARMGSVPTITPDVTFGAIYVVRNPLDVVVSYSHHNGVSLDTAIDVLCFPDFRVPAGNGQVPQLICDWTSHVKSWLFAPGLYRKVLRYEDMLANPLSAFESTIDFLKLPRDRKKLKRAVRNSSFGVLAGQEEQRGFRERPVAAQRFFRRGGSGGWREELSPLQVKRVVERHRPMMIELHYLSPDGEILAQ
jgi:hypothetical protein